jgi:hypothetical protein
MEAQNVIIHRLIKQLVDIDESFTKAQRVVNERKKLQEKLKELFEREGIDQYVLNEDGYFAVLGFKKSVQTRVDITALP